MSGMKTVLIFFLTICQKKKRQKETQTVVVMINTWIFFLRFSLFMRGTERQKHRQREKQAPQGEPDVGLNLRTRRSLPEPKADSQPLSHPGIPVFYN